MYHITTIDKDGMVVSGAGWWDHNSLVEMLMMMGQLHHNEAGQEVFISES